MSGTIPLSLSQQFDKFGKPLGSGRLYIIQAGTTSTPQIAYQDGALTIPYPGGSVIQLDAAGRIGQFFLADGLVKVRLVDKDGIPQIEADGIQVIGPSSGGGGGGGSVDPTTILATGDVKYSYRTGVLAGFVRCNARTIGSAASGATERANADTQALFEYLWNADSSLTVAPSRGASANADWLADKRITLPDFRGRTLIGPDSMGNPSPAGRIGSGAGSFGVNNDTLGKAGGAEVHTLTLAHLPTGISSRNPSQTVTVTTTQPVLFGASTASTTNGGGAGFTYWNGLSGTSSAVISTGNSNDIIVTSTNTGGAAHDTMPPAIIVTTYIKL